MSTDVSAWLLCVSAARILQRLACVCLDLKWLLPACQPPPPSVLLTAEPVCLGVEAGKTCGVGGPRGAGGRAALPAADWSQSALGPTSKIRYLQYFLWLGVCVSLEDVPLVWAVTVLTCNNNPAMGTYPPRWKACV